MASPGPLAWVAALSHLPVTPFTSSATPAGEPAAATVATPSAAPAERGAFDELAGALGAMRATVSALLALAALEARRAGLSLIGMAACVALAAVCVVIAWLGIIAALVLGAMSLGLNTVGALVAGAALNLVVGFVLVRLASGLGTGLWFPATRRQIAGVDAEATAR